MWYRVEYCAWKAANAGSKFVTADDADAPVAAAVDRGWSCSNMHRESLQGPRMPSIMQLCSYAAASSLKLSLHCDRVMTSSALRPPRSLLAFSSPKPRQLICTDGAALPPIATTASRSLCRTVVLSRKTLSSDLGVQGGGCPSKVCLAINETRHRSRTRAKSRCQDETQTNGRIAHHRHHYRHPPRNTRKRIYSRPRSSKQPVSTCFPDLPAGNSFPRHSAS